MQTIGHIPSNWGFPKGHFKKGDIIHIPIISDIVVVDFGDVPTYTEMREERYTYIPAKPVIVIVGSRKEKK